MHEAILGEFMGTLILVLLGNGVVAGALLKESKSEGNLL
jgi:glycerol uptake facilitator protein